MDWITFHRETVETLLVDGRALFEAHAKEDATHPDIPLSINEAQYARMEELDLVRIYTVRHNGQLAGYGVVSVYHSLLFQTSKQGICEALYLDPSVRKGRTALQFLQYIQDGLRDLGVQVMRLHARPDSAFDQLLRRDHRVTHLEYDIRLDQGD